MEEENEEEEQEVEVAAAEQEEQQRLLREMYNHYPDVCLYSCRNLGYPFYQAKPAPNLCGPVQIFNTNRD